MLRSALNRMNPTRRKRGACWMLALAAMQGLPQSPAGAQVSDPPADNAATLYVSPTGADWMDGASPTVSWYRRFPWEPWQVTGPVRTIQKAVDPAGTGDVIEVAPGGVCRKHADRDADSHDSLARWRGGVSVVVVTF